MRSRSRSNVRSRVPGGRRAWQGLLIGGVSCALAGTASAADAGAARGGEPSRRSETKTSSGTIGAEAPAGELRSRFFPKLIENPAVLSERVRARLEERARARALQAGANNAAAPAQEPRQLSDEDLAGAIERVDPNEGGAPLRRMVAFENDDGVTVLSNRARDVPEVTPAAPRTIVNDVAEEPAPAPVQREATQTRRLRLEPDAKRAARTPEPRAVWPWLVFGTAAFSFLGAGWWLLRGRARDASGRG